MRLYRMELQAVGPFAGHHVIDFEALGRSGLFLLEGPTGAGKSTLIDAVVFALYGGLAGAESSKQRLHSHHAEPDVEPFVDLVFEVEAGVFRIRRSPAHERPKKRGTGTTPVNASVTLTRLHDVDQPDRGDVVSTRNEEAGLEVELLIGLTRTQFLQTVVLPQGEFATFLRSSGEDRKKLLEKIFRTDVYERITAELVARRRDAAARTESARAALSTASEVAARVADVEPTAVDPAALEAQVESDHASAVEAVSTAAAELAEADQALRAAETLATALRKRSDLVERRRRLAVQQPGVDEAIERIDLAERAARVTAYRTAAAAAAAELTSAQAHHAQAVAAAPAGLTDTDAEIDRLTADIERFTELASLEAGFAARDAALVDLADRKTALVQERAEIEVRQAELPELRQAVETRLTDLRARLSERGSREAEAAAAELVLLAARDAETAEVRLAEAAATAKKFAGDATTATEVLRDLQVSRIRGMAGELAGQLAVGESCMVCGSQAHPHPATRDADHVDQHRVDAAQQHVADLTRALDEARTDHVVQEQQVKHLREQADGLDVVAAQARRDAADAAVAELQQLEAQQVDALTELERLDSDAEGFRVVLGSIGTKLAALDEQVRQAAESLEQDRSQVLEHRGEEPVASILERLTAERAAVRRLAETVSALASADRRAGIAGSDLAARLVEHGFAGADDAEAGELVVPELERLRHLVSAHRDEQSRVDEGWSDPTVSTLSGDERPDVEGAAATRAAAASVHGDAVGRARLAERRRTQVLSALTALAGATAALAEAEADAAAVIRLAGLADASSPENLKRLTLGTYVLLRRFDEVVAAANARLGPMSDGRYQLRVADERERSSSGRRTGLSLAVLDADTGREREPRTLSGGETFYVSLCLALGLADVVSAESGGVRLGTLFVDEGFGSLDPQTLDAVMAELTQLAAGGRAVGLVSHVEELKQRVADRIEVRRAPDGVSTLQVLA